MPRRAGNRRLNLLPSQLLSDCIKRPSSPVRIHENGTITEHDSDTFERLKKTRNKLAPRLFEVVSGQLGSNHKAQFDVLVDLPRKIEVWWIVDVESATDPDYDGQEIDEEGIVPGPIFTLQMLIRVASGDTSLLEAWRNVRSGKYKEE